MVTLFFSYSHIDEALRNELEVHLAMLKREGLIDTRFFEGSLAELQERNAGIETRFKRIDAHSIGAVIYRNGKAMARCGIRNSSRGGAFGRGITFSHEESAPTNSSSESLSVGVGEQSLFLKPSGMQMFGRPDRNAHLTAEGAAEYYWSMLIEPLQR